MKNFKKILVFLVLVVGCVCCFCSCSCSSKKPPGQTNPPDGGSGGAPIVYYNVSVVIHGNSGSGEVVSSTGGNSHEAGSSPIYTVMPSAGYAIEAITIDGAVEYTHLIGGYKEEPIAFEISNISKDTQVAATFKQMEYTVECNIVGDEGSGTVVSSTGEDIHLGATSPTYTVTPSEGYCVYSLTVDGNIIYDYQTQFVSNQLGATSEYVLSEPFEIIGSDHEIDVEFRKLVNINDIVASSNYYKNMFGNLHELVEDDGKYGFTGMTAVTFAEVEGYEDMPVGSTHKLQFEFSSLAGRVFADIKILISFDGGESFIDGFSWKAYTNNPAYGISYNGGDKILQINNFTDKIQFKFVGEPMRIDLTIFDADKQTTVGTSGVYLFSDYIITGGGGNLCWYYCLSSSYHLSNLYIDATIYDVTIGTNVFKSIYLDETMLMLNYNDEYEPRIVLIHSTTKLTN